MYCNPIANKSIITSENGSKDSLYKSTPSATLNDLFSAQSKNLLVKFMIKYTKIKILLINSQQKT